MPYNFDLIRKTKQEKHRAKQIKEGTPTLCDKEDYPISVYGASARKYKQEYILGKNLPCGPYNSKGFKRLNMFNLLEYKGHYKYSSDLINL